MLKNGGTFLKDTQLGIWFRSPSHPRLHCSKKKECLLGKEQAAAAAMISMSSRKKAKLHSYFKLCNNQVLGQNYLEPENGVDEGVLR